MTMRFSFSNAAAEGDTRLFSAEEVLGRALLLLWFGFVIFVQMSRITLHVLNANSHPIHSVDLIKGLLGLSFSLMAVGMTLARRGSKATATGLEPRIVAIVGTYLMVAIPLLPAGHASDALKIAGEVLMIAGVVASIYCLSWLGRSYSIMATARKLVTAGPYRIVRHPLYAAECLAMLGIIVTCFSPFAVAIALMTMALWWRRAINEERVLRSVFPEYDDYAREVPRFVPRFLTGGALRPAEAGAIFGT